MRYAAIYGGGGDTFRAQRPRYVGGLRAARGHGEYSLYHFARACIGYKAVLIRRILLIAIRRKRRNVGPFPHFGGERGAYLLRYVAGVHFVYNVFEGRNVRIRPFRIVAVVYGYAAHALAWEIYLRILPRRDIVAPQAGQILDYNKVDPLRLDVRYHPPELRPLEAYARITVVRIFIIYGVSVLRRVAAQHLPLRGYACALRRAVVIL